MFSGRLSCRGLCAPCGILAFPRCAGALSARSSPDGQGPRSAVVSQAAGNPRPRGVGISTASLRRPVRDFLSEIFPCPAAKTAGKRYISGSRFPGRAVGLCFGVTACPCETTGDSPL